MSVIVSGTERGIVIVVVIAIENEIETEVEAGVEVAIETGTEPVILIAGIGVIAREIEIGTGDIRVRAGPDPAHTHHLTCMGWGVEIAKVRVEEVVVVLETLAGRVVPDLHDNPHHLHTATAKTTTILVAVE